MKRRLALTLIWIASFVLVVLAVELYYWAYPTERKLIEGERFEAYAPLVSVYGAYLAAILVAWFKKPFARLRIDRVDGNARFLIAMISTVLFNVLVLYFVSLAHWRPDASALEAIKTAMKLAGLFSILVAPVNLYYFGVELKSKE